MLTLGPWLAAISQGYFTYRDSKYARNLFLLSVLVAEIRFNSRLPYKSGRQDQPFPSKFLRPITTLRHLEVPPMQTSVETRVGRWS